MNHAFHEHFVSIHEQARKLRVMLGGLLGLPSPDRVVLAPGTTASLRILFAAKGIETVILGPEEYCDEHHFWPLSVLTSPIADIAAIARRTPSKIAVVLSVVSWKGTRFPVESHFHALRLELKDRCPLLVADYSHGGASGFPPCDQIPADIIVGDFSKWILPPNVADELCFLYAGTDEMWKLCKNCFGAFYLATESVAERAARWVAPREVTGSLMWIKSQSVSRHTLLAQFERNRSFMRTLPRSGTATDCCMVWFRSDAAPKWIAPDLLWETPEGIRVLCRHDVQQSYEKGGLFEDPPVGCL